MDKSFNDQELSDIMKEIEALEEEFHAEEKVEASSVMEELAEMEEEVAVPHAQAAPAKVIHFEENKHQAPAADQKTSMSFRVQGNLTLELQFEIGSRMVGIEINESGLQILMDGGMTFNVPLEEKKSSKKSA